MQMQKKVTLKEDGRFLIYYHFPNTATEEETQVFAGIQELAEGEEKKKKEDSDPNPDSLNAGGSSHV